MQMKLSFFLLGLFLLLIWNPILLNEVGKKRDSLDILWCFLTHSEEGCQVRNDLVLFLIAFLTVSVPSDHIRSSLIVS